MGSKFESIARQARPAAAIENVSFLGFPQGLCTVVPASMVQDTELVECINLQVNRGGQLQTRAGMKKLNHTSIGKVITLASCSIEDKVVYLAQSVDNSIRKIDFTGTATALGTAEGPASIVSFGGKAMVADGGYLKYIDSTDVLKLAWDGGTPGLFDNRGDSISGAINYTAAATNQVNFTTPSWPVGYTMPPTKLEIKVGRVGTGGTGNIVLSIYRTSDNVQMAYGALEVQAPFVAPDPGDFEVANMTVVHELAPNTAYYVRLAMSTYNVANYIKWYTGDSSVPICGVSPGLPPKCSNLLVHDRRLWAYGDDTNKGTLFYSNFAPFDWSTAGQAGYLTTLDNHKDTYPIGSVVSYFGTLFIFGAEETPYLLQLSGTGTDFVLTDLRQPIWSAPKMTAEILNDVWMLSRGGVSSLTGVNLYGDVRTYSESVAIDDQIEKLWTSEAYTGYYIDRGQLWVVLGGKIFVAHTKAPTEGINRVRYPWSEFQFNFVPTCLGQWDDIVVGAEDGFVYAPNDLLTKDDGLPFYISMKTKYFQSSFRLIDVLEARVLLDSRTGVSYDFVCYKDNDTFEETYRWQGASALHDDVIIDDLGDAVIDDMDVIIDPAGVPLVIRLGFRCFAYQVHLDDIKMIGKPAYIDGLTIRYRPMED